jgi:hypothetical protein
MLFKKLDIVPTVLILIFLIKVVNGQFDDPDYYWHLKTGEYIVVHGLLPYKDVFSYTNFGKPWVPDEWLFQVILYLVHTWGGDLGVKIFVAFGLTTCIWFCYSICEKILGGDKGKALIIALLYCAYIISVAPRPHLLTFLFFALFLNILLRFKYFGETSHLWIIPLVMLLWVNVHGGYFIGLVLLLLFIIGEWFSLFLAGSMDSLQRRRLIRLTLVSLLGLLATLANPEFIHHWIYPFKAIGMWSSQGIIEEWRSPDFHYPIFAYWFMGVGVFVAAMIYSPRKPDATELMIPVTFVASAFLSRRNLPLAALAMAPFVAVYLRAGLTKNIAEFLARLRRGGAAHETVAVVKEERHLGSHEYLVNWALILLTTIALAVIYQQRQKTIETSLNSILPVKATNFIIREGIKGRMFNTYHYGGYLIYRLYPQQRVFIDPRTVMYGDDFLRKALEIYSGGSQWEKLFNQFHIDYVICESEAPIRQLLVLQGKFHLVFDDGMHSVLLRDIPRFHPIIERYEDKPAND